MANNNINSKYICNYESLRSLENLMNEFFHDLTSNQRKREIEEILNNFSKQNNCWEQSLSYLTQTNNEFTQMYCLSVLENVISIKWLSLGPEKCDLRQSIWKYLLTNHQTVPQYISNKTAKLLVNIARIDWPHVYPDFIQNILDLLQSGNTMSLALMLLKTAIEELTVSRDDLCAQRKQELNKLLQLEMGRILLSLTNVMEVILDKHFHCNFLTATPPPSPSQSPTQDSNLSRGDILCNAFELSLSRGLLQTIPDMDSESLQLSSQVLLSLAQLMAFMPLSLYHQISDSLLAAIFVFATFGCNNSQDMSYNKVSSVRLGVLAMNCINEIMSKSSTTIETNEFIFNMFKNTFHLLQKLTKTNDINTQCSPLENLDEEYISKFTEFLRFFMSGHLPRFEKMSTFPIMEFLGLVFQYTFKQTSNDSFLSALEVWTIFIDYLNIKIKQEMDSKQINAILNRYKEPIVSLVLHICRKIQLKYNQRAIDELDNENIDDDFNTEFEKYLFTCIEIIAKIADIYPLETYEIVSQFHNENLQSFFGLELYIRKDENNKQINLNLSETDLCRLHCSLRDLSTALKLVGRLADHFITENFNRWFSSTKLFIEKLVQALILCNKSQFHKQETLAKDFIDVCAQIMATIKAYCHWLQQYCTQQQSNNSNSDSVVIISAIIENCIEIICDNNINVITNKSHINTVLHSAIHSLYSITTTVRPVFILNMECVQILFSRVCAYVKCDNTSNGFQSNIIPNISPEDERLLCRSISNMLLLPWLTVSDSEQNWETRTLYHDMFIEAIVEPFENAIKCQQITNNGTLSQQSTNNSVVYCRSLNLLSDIVENHKDSPTRSKQLLFKSISTTMEAFINIFPTYFTNPVISENCLNLFTIVFDVLRIQISFQFVEKTIQLMLKLFSTNALNVSFDVNQANGMSSEPLSSKVIPKFLKMLTFIVQQPGSLFKSLLPGMINFAFDQICPTIVNTDCPQLKKSLYEFLFQLLLNNWKYFYPNNSILGNTFNGNNQQKEVLENADAFINIMNIFAQSFRMNDITVFKQNLDALEVLNTRLKLYQKEVFKQTMVKHFLCLFIQTLLDKSLNLLQDDISNTVHNMSSVDFDNFFSTFIPQFLYNCEGLNDIQRNILAKSFNPNEKDFPSFVNNLNIFLNDLRYYRLCNKY